MTSERWNTFAKRDQLLHIGAEFERARTAEEQGYKEHLHGALDRALQLIDLTLADPKWQIDAAQLRGLREEVVRRQNSDPAALKQPLYQLL